MSGKGRKPSRAAIHRHTIGIGCCDGVAREPRHLPHFQLRARRPGVGAAWRYPGERPCRRRSLAREMGARSAVVGSLLDLPAGAAAWRSRHLHRDAAAGAGRYRAIRTGDDRTRHRLLHADAADRPSTRRRRGGVARQRGGCGGARRLAARRLGADLLARLHRAGDLLRMARLGARTGAARPDCLRAGRRHGILPVGFSARGGLGDLP